MTAQRWEQLRNMIELPMDVYWEYYQEQGGMVKEYGIFKPMFERWLNMGFKVVDKGQLKPVNFTCALNRVYDYYNKKFNAVTT